MDERLRELIKKRRKEKGISLEKMAEKLGYKSKSSYYYLENGVTKLKFQHLKQMTEILEFTPEDIKEIFFNKVMDMNYQPRIA